ncbi:MAG: hypothetical protein ACRC8Z_10770 [Empedobacter falsenii]
MKTLLQHLNEVSRERGCKDFRWATDEAKVFLVEDIIKEAGIRLQKELQKRIAENVRMKTKDNVHELSMMDDWSEIDKQSITDEKLLVR